MARIVVWFWVLVVVLVAQTQNSDKVDVKTFLENIRKMLQETVEKMRKYQENRMKRRKDKKNKIKTRKMLMNKLANPYIIFRRQHTVINVNPPSNRDNLQDNNNRIDVNTGRISPQTVNKVLRANPVFNPFRTDRLKDILSKIQRPRGNVAGNVQNSSTSTAIPATAHQQYEQELLKWFEEVYSKIEWFWDMVYRLFILDEKRFKYLSKVLCKGEITTTSSWGNFNSSVYHCIGIRDNLPDRFNVINLYSPINMPCDSLEPHKLRVDTKKLSEVITCVESKYINWSIYNNGQCTPSLYTNAKLIGDKERGRVIRAEGIRPAYTSGKSLCYNLAALNFFGYERNLEHYYNSSYISSKVKSFIQYVQFMGRIYKEKIIPVVVDMCYMRCLCEDIGIGCRGKEEKNENPEDVIILLLYNLTSVYKNVLEQWERYAEVKNFISGIFPDCSQNIKSVEEFLKKVGGELLQLVEEYGKKNIGKIPSDILKKEIKEKITSNKVAGAFKMMYESATELFMHILKSKLLDMVVEKFKELDKTVIEGIEKKDKCFLEFAKMMVSKEIAGQNKSFIPYLSYLVSKNIDAPAVKLGELYINKPAEGYMKIKNILSYFKVLNYRTYAVLSSYKMEKCYYQKTDDELKGLTDELESYGCIFQDSNMNIGCATDAFSFLGEAEKKLFMELFKGIGINLGNLSDKISKVGNNGISFYKDVGAVNEMLNMCKDMEGDPMKMIEIISNSFVDTGTAWISKGCEPQNKYCNGKRCIELISDICKDPIPQYDFGNPSVCKCRICDVSGTPRLEACNGTPYSHAFFFNTGAGTVLESDLCRFEVEEGGVIVRKYYDNACVRMISGYMKICEWSDKENGEIYEYKVRSLIKKMLLCGIVKEKNVNTGVYTEKIEKLGVDYLKLLNQNSSPEKLKELYRRYKDGTLCND